MKRIAVVITLCFLSLVVFSQEKQKKTQSSGTKTRSAETGQYVPKSYAKKNPSTTVLEKQKSYNTKSTGKKK